MRTVTCTEDRECFISKMDTSVPGQDPNYLIPLAGKIGKIGKKSDNQQGFGRRKKRVSHTRAAKGTTATTIAPLKKSTRKKAKKSILKKASVKKSIVGRPKCKPCKKTKVAKKKPKKVVKKKKC